jgi:hypothetical protein
VRIHITFTLPLYALCQEAVLVKTLPLLIQDDAINMPDSLCFEPTMINPKIVKKALRLVEAEQESDGSFIRAQAQPDGSTFFFVHRSKSRVNTKLTVNSIKVRIMMDVIAFARIHMH